MNIFASLATSLMIILAGVGKAENYNSVSLSFKVGCSEIIADSIKNDSWSFFAEINKFFIPDGNDFVLPSFTAKKDWLHIEARYNYEALKSGSVWIGYNLAAGKEPELSATPMLGAILGSMTGIAPGIELELNYGVFNVYTEWEYVLDIENTSDNFLYTWSEVSIAPEEWLSFGIVAQRTKNYQSEFDIQRGVFAALTLSNFGFTTYVFNPDIEKPAVVLNASVEF